MHLVHVNMTLSGTPKGIFYTEIPDGQRKLEKSDWRLAFSLYKEPNNGKYLTIHRLKYKRYRWPQFFFTRL